MGAIDNHSRKNNRIAAAAVIGVIGLSALAYSCSKTDVPSKTTVPNYALNLVAVNSADGTLNQTVNINYNTYNTKVENTYHIDLSFCNPCNWKWDIFSPPKGADNPNFYIPGDNHKPEKPCPSKKAPSPNKSHKDESSLEKKVNTTPVTVVAPTHVDSVYQQKQEELIPKYNGKDTASTECVTPGFKHVQFPKQETYDGGNK